MHLLHIQMKIALINGPSHVALLPLGKMGHLWRVTYGKVSDLPATALSPIKVRGHHEK